MKSSCHTADKPAYYKIPELTQTTHKIQPLISIAMCVYNTRCYIEAAVNSIVNQTYPHWELIIGDDGSTDGTREWLKGRFAGDPRVKLFFHERNKGYVANKNFCIAKASGAYVTQCDSDDYFDMTLLEKQVAVLNSHQNIHMVACGYHRIDGHGNIYETTGPDKDVVISKNWNKAYPFWFPPLLVKRSIYSETGEFTSYFNGMGDDQYWVSKANEGYEIFCLKEPLYYYRDNPNSITKVLDSKRKLIVPALLQALLAQRKATGTDFLEKNDTQQLSALEKSFLTNRKYMGEQYRLWAAINTNNKHWPVARALLLSSFLQYPFNALWYRTFTYYLRSRFKN